MSIMEGFYLIDFSSVEANHTKMDHLGQKWAYDDSLKSPRCLWPGLTEEAAMVDWFYILTVTDGHLISYSFCSSGSPHSHC